MGGGSRDIYMFNKLLLFNANFEEKWTWEEVKRIDK